MTKYDAKTNCNLNYAQYLLSIREFNDFEVPKIVEDRSCYEIWNKKGLWKIDELNSRLKFRDINDEFCNWCKKRHKNPEYGYRDVNKQARPNINGEFIFTFIIKYEYKVNFLFSCIMGLIQLVIKILV